MDKEFLNAILKIIQIKKEEEETKKEEEETKNY